MSFSRATEVQDHTGNGANIARLRCGVVLRKSDGGLIFKLTMNSKAQTLLFGEFVVGKRLRVDVGRAQDHGRIRVALDPEMGVVVKKTPRSGVYVRVKAWDLLGGQPQAMADAEFISTGPEGVVLRLPSFGQPAAMRERTAAEFALRPAGGA